MEYKITIGDYENAVGQERIEVLYGYNDAWRLVNGRITFDTIEDLDHFIYQLRQASFDYKINQCKRPPHGSMEE